MLHDYIVKNLTNCEQEVKDRSSHSIAYHIGSAAFLVVLLFIGLYFL